jgi:hypothetical protein
LGSWWLKKYPNDDDIDLVRRSRFLYVTHSHVDHFHWPSLRRLGPHRVLHPAFPNFAVPGFLESHGFRNRTLMPLVWYSLSENVRVDTKINLKLTHLFFILMNLRDYEHFKYVRDFLEIVRFYLPVVLPKLYRIATRGDKSLAIAFEKASSIKA